VAESAGVLESVTVKVSETPDTIAVGLPLMVPLAEFSDSPAGRTPVVSAQA
jgi:hypothetical protein